MSYATEQEKAEQPSYAELYELVVMAGDNEIVHWTSYGQSVTFRSAEYVPRAIKRSGFMFDRTSRDTKVTVAATIMEPTSTYIAQSPYAPCMLTIWRVYLANPDTDYIKLFVGKLESVSIDKFVMSATFASQSGAFSRLVPRNLYSPWCCHNLFDDHCQVSELNWRRAVTVAGITGNAITVPEIAGFANQFYRAGTMQFHDERRLITDQTGTVITILFPFGGRLAVGSTVHLLPGCSGHPAICKIRFNNIDNYLGFPYIPTKNVVIWGFR